MKKFIAGAIKSLTNIIFGGRSSFWGMLLPRTKYNYAKEVGDGLGSSVIMAPVLWIARTYPEAPIVFEKDGELEHDHAMLELIRKPNPFYSGHIMAMATIISFSMQGNAYWLKLRNNQQKVIQLWYVPSWMISPKWPDDGSKFISHYDYNPLGKIIRIEAEDIVHFRYGLDPRNIRLGLSPLGSLMREVFTDDEAANFTASLLRNSGVPGLIIAPDSDTAIVTPADKRAIKAKFKKEYGGDKRGEPIVMSAKTIVKQLGFSPQEMDLSRLREIPEERVTAILGIPAAVVGFGTGLQQTKVGAPQPLSARLWTPEGPTTMGAVFPGDKIAIPGGWGQVRHVYPQGKQDIYCITFQDGSTAESTIDHLWDVHTPNQGRRVVPLSEIASWPTWMLKRAALPLQEVTEFDERRTLIPPYVLGLLLADGSFRSNLFFSNADEQIVGTIKEKVMAGYDVRHRSRHDYSIVYRDHAKGRGKGSGISGGMNPFIDELRRLGLWMLYSHEKFIPDLYRYNSSRVRLQLLQGILDGDGYVNLHGQPAVEQTSVRLAEGITEIVQSLGGYTLCAPKKANRSIHFISGRPFSSNHDRIHQTIVIEDGSSLFFCSAKRDRCRPRMKSSTRKFRSIELVRDEQTQCIEVDGGLYLTDSFLVTHNTMSEMREMAYESCIIPMQRLTASEIENSLLPDFESDPKKYHVTYDLSKVRVLQEDENKKATRMDTMVKGGWVKVSEARKAMGFEVDPEHEIYLRPFNLVVVPVGTSPEEQIPAPPEEGGNGKAKIKYFIPLADKKEIGQQLVAQFYKDWQHLSGLMTADLEKVFDALGQAAADAWEQVAEDRGITRLAAINTPEKKEEITEDDILTDIIIASMAIVVLDYSVSYLRAAETTYKTINKITDLGIDFTQAAEMRILAAGGTRLGLVDLTEQSRAAVFQALQESRRLGEDFASATQRIREHVSRGRYLSANTRSQIIARTEMKYAQNMASLEAYREGGIERVRIVDGQLETSCDFCIERDGRIITVAEAEALWEHPNGTLSLIPAVE